MCEAEDVVSQVGDCVEGFRGGAVVAGGGGGGGGLPAGDVAAGWKGWLKVEREAVGGFAMGMSVSDARARREERQKVVDKAGWAAESPWGGFVFHE